MAIMKKSTNNKCFQDCVDKRGLPMWKSVWSFLSILGLELPYDPAILLVSIFPKESNALYHSDVCTPVFIYSGTVCST